MCIRVQNDLFMQYMVKRKGLDFTEYGLVDARAVKRQRLGGENTDAGYSPSPATLEHLHVTSATQKLFLCYSAIKQLSLTMTVPVTVACLRSDYQCVGMLTKLFSHLAAVGAVNLRKS